VKKLLAFLLALPASLTFASSCPDPNVGEPLIGGSSIHGGVEVKHKPLKFTPVRLYSAGKLSWSGKTDGEGRFEIHNLVSGKYRLDVSRWGTTNVELKHELDKTGTGQIPYYYLVLLDNGCAGVTKIVN
jgi:hypothetical protein